MRDVVGKRRNGISQNIDQNMHGALSIGAGRPRIYHKCIAREVGEIVWSRTSHPQFRSRRWTQLRLQGRDLRAIRHAGTRPTRNGSTSPLFGYWHSRTTWSEPLGLASHSIAPQHNLTGFWSKLASVFSPVKSR